MSTTSAQMLLTLPDLNADPGVWDTAINASLARIDLHDHSANLGVKVKPSGIDINAALTFAGYAATNLAAAAFAVQAAGAITRSLWVKTADNELYWRTSAGTDVQVTSGTGLNMSLVGGITGDYAAASAALYYDDAAEAYRFLEAAPLPNDWSYVKAGGFDLYEHASAIANYVGLRSPAALAATYNLTFPAALPGSTLLQQVSSAGVISWSNTIGGAVTMSSSLAVGTSATVGTTLGVTGLITATAGLTAAANQHVTVSGTGAFKHGDRVLLLSAMDGVYVSNWVPALPALASNSNVAMDLVAPLHVGDRVKSLTVALFGNGTADITVSAAVYSAVAGATSIGSVLVSNQPASWSDTTLDLTDTTLAAGEVLILSFSPNATGISVGNTRLTYDRP